MAGRRPSSRITFPSARVTIIDRPTGRQPWLTTVRMASGPSRIRPTAPSSKTSPSSARRFPPGACEPLAIPPTTRSPGARVSKVWNKRSAGKLNGSPISSTVRPANPRAAASPGSPTMSDSSQVRRRGRTWIDAGRRMAQRETAGSPSTSRPSPMIVSPVTARKCSLIRRSRQIRARSLTAEA